MDKDSRGPSTPEKPRKRWYLLAAVALVLVVFMDGYDQLELSESSCETASADSAPPFYVPIYNAFLNFMNNDSSSQVSVIAIKADLVDIQQNLCLGRSYLADLLTAVASQRPAVIVIDKYFSPESCASDPGSTRALIETVQSLKIPVVVGESTDYASRPAKDGSCLVQKRQLDFGKADLSRGLVSLNANKEQIPIRWPVLPRDPSSSAEKSVQKRSLALVAASVFAPDLSRQKRFQSLLGGARQPYARISSPLPPETSSDLLCSAGTSEMRSRWSLHCSSSERKPNLLGKVVVIGAENDRDRWIALEHPMWGFQLQAQYIDALLTGHYLRATGAAPVFAFLAFLVLLELVPVLVSWFWKGSHLAKFFERDNEIWWVCLWSTMFIVILLIVSISMRYLPPLLILSAVLIILLARIAFTLWAVAKGQLMSSGQEVKG